MKGDMSKDPSQDVDIGFRPQEALRDIKFRRFSGGHDYDAISDICIKSWKADGVEFIKTPDDFRSAYVHDPDRDPGEELLIAELHGRAVGLAETSLIQKSKSELRCHQYAHVLPDYRHEGLREALLRFNEDSLRRRVIGRPADERRSLYSWAFSEPNDWRKILVSEGYEEEWHLFEMKRPNLDDIPDAPLPEGAVVRPIEEKDYRKVWETSRDMFIDQPWSNEDHWSEKRYRQWLSSPTFMPDLWQIAWDGDDIIGSVQNYIDVAENEAFGTKRGHTETIFVAPSWRGKGLAKALIARSLSVLKERGMKEAMLDTEQANVHEAYKVYQRMGFEIVNQFTFFQKPL